jgi:2,4-dienoyl-CoA reductase-like NADH-dependent reductase (Old Yellow Enzyme family)
MRNQPLSILFEPVQFAATEAKNRIVMAPMVTNFADSDDNVTDRQIDYYKERSRGGVGTIVVEAAMVDRQARISKHQIGIYDDRFIVALSRLCKAIQGAGALALLQVCHGGPKTLTAAGAQTTSVSPVGVRKCDVPAVLSHEDLGQVRRRFLDACRRAHQAGFDGVELHAAHFYLLGASISPFTNHRTDVYGGSTANRTRLTREIIHDIKDSIGTDFPVWVRINACESIKPGLSLEEGCRVAGQLTESGADAVHVSAYTLPINKKIKATMNITVGAIPVLDTPPGPFLDYAAAIKEAIDVPVVAVAKLDDPGLASDAVASGKCDFIALARQMICDPYWPEKVRQRQLEKIIRCKYCMTCHTAQQQGERIRCAQNKNLLDKTDRAGDPN